MCFLYEKYMLLYAYFFVACFHETLYFLRKLPFLLCMEMLMARPWGSLSLSELGRACVFSSKNKKKFVFLGPIFTSKRWTYVILVVLVIVNREEKCGQSSPVVLSFTLYQNVKCIMKKSKVLDVIILTILVFIQTTFFYLKLHD